MNELPSEILTEIVDFLPLTDIKNSRLVFQDLNDIYTNHINHIKELIRQNNIHDQELRKYFNIPDVATLFKNMKHIKINQIKTKYDIFDFHDELSTKCRQITNTAAPNNMWYRYRYDITKILTSIKCAKINDRYEILTIYKIFIKKGIPSQEYRYIKITVINADLGHKLIVSMINYNSF
jgi:hypothetical protein